MTYRDRVSSRSSELPESGRFRGQRKRGDQIVFFTISEIAEIFAWPNGPSTDGFTLAISLCIAWAEWCGSPSRT